MKTLLVGSISLMSLLFTTSHEGCKKETVHCKQNIQGLWVGTYTVGEGFPVPAGTSFFFSFSIHPGGKLSYKSKGFYMGSYEYITFADGTWKLDGNAFTFSVKTINYAEGEPQLLQTGSATYNNTNGTLTGVISNGPGSSESFTMAEVN